MSTLFIQHHFDFLGMHHRRMTTETRQGSTFQETYQYPSRKAMKKMKSAIKSNVNSRSELYRELERQVTNRVNNLPAGSTQEIVLDASGRGFSKDVIDNVVANIQSRCAPVYKDIPVTVMSY